jgi:hypothetical protein
MNGQVGLSTAQTLIYEFDLPPRPLLNSNSLMPLFMFVQEEGDSALSTFIIDDIGVSLAFNLKYSTETTGF